MIKFDTVMVEILDRIKTYLRGSGYTKTIQIYDNAGIAVNDYVEDNSDTVVSKLYGVYRNQTSQISTVSDALNMLTGTAVIDLLVDAVPDEDGKFPEVSELVALLNDCAGQVTGQYVSITEDGVSYAVLPVMSPAAVGTYQEESSNWGAYVPVSVQIAFTALEGAVLPSEMQIYVDGYKIPITDMVLSRVATSTADVPSNSVRGSTVCTEDSTTFEVQLSCPYMQTASSMASLYFGYDLYGKAYPANYAHCVIIRDEMYPARDIAYLMSVAKVTLTRQSGAVVGLNVNMLELSPEAAYYGEQEGWTTKTATVSDGGSYTVSLGTNKPCAVFWGDGSSTITTVSASHTYTTGGTYTVAIYTIGEMGGRDYE